MRPNKLYSSDIACRTIWTPRSSSRDHLSLATRSSSITSLNITTWRRGKHAIRDKIERSFHVVDNIALQVPYIQERDSVDSMNANGAILSMMACMQYIEMLSTYRPSTDLRVLIHCWRNLSNCVRGISGGLRSSQTSNVNRIPYSPLPTMTTWRCTSTICEPCRISCAKKFCKIYAGVSGSIIRSYSKAVKHSAGYDERRCGYYRALTILFRHFKSLYILSTVKQRDSVEEDMEEAGQAQTITICLLTLVLVISPLIIFLVRNSTTTIQVIY